MNSKIHENQTWLDKAFMWEKRQLYSQASFFYHCMGDQDRSNYFSNLEAQQYIYAKS